MRIGGYTPSLLLQSGQGGTDTHHLCCMAGREGLGVGSEYIRHHRHLTLGQTLRVRLSRASGDGAPGRDAG